MAPIGAMRRWLLSTAAIALTSGCIGGARPITLPADTVPLQIEEKTFDSGLRVVVERSSTVLSLTTTVAIADQLARYWVFGWEPSKAEHYPELVSQTTISQFMEQLETCFSRLKISIVGDESAAVTAIAQAREGLSTSE